MLVIMVLSIVGAIMDMNSGEEFAD